MTSRREVLAALALGAVTLTACSAPRQLATSARPLSALPVTNHLPLGTPPPSHALTGGSGP